jgi:hypothetical protein
VSARQALRPASRAWNWLYARVWGYFWLPCPLCGRHFGGHEWRITEGRASTIPVPGGLGGQQAICPDCTQAGRGNAAWRAWQQQ